MAKSTQACYVISVAAKLVDIHPQTLRYYERLGLVRPSRSDGRIRLYSDVDIERVQQIRRLSEDLGVNLAGVDVILNLTEKIKALERELVALQTELARLRRPEQMLG